MSAQEYLQQKLLSAGFRVPKRGAALERTHSEDASDDKKYVVADDADSVAEDASAPAKLDTLRMAESAARLDSSQARPGGEGPCQSASDRQTAADRAASIDRLERQDMLWYKEGRLSKHGLLVATAKRRVASRGS